MRPHTSKRGPDRQNMVRAARETSTLWFVQVRPHRLDVRWMFTVTSWLAAFAWTAPSFHVKSPTIHPKAEKTAPGCCWRHQILPGFTYLNVEKLHAKRAQPSAKRPVISCDEQLVLVLLAIWHNLVSRNNHAPFGGAGLLVRGFWGLPEGVAPLNSLGFIEFRA